MTAADQTARLLPHARAMLTSEQVLSTYRMIVDGYLQEANDMMWCAAVEALIMRGYVVAQKNAIHGLYYSSIEAVEQIADDSGWIG